MFLRNMACVVKRNTDGTTEITDPQPLINEELKTVTVKENGVDVVKTYTEYKENEKVLKVNAKDGEPATIDLTLLDSNGEPFKVVDERIPLNKDKDFTTIEDYRYKEQNDKIAAVTKDVAEIKNEISKTNENIEALLKLLSEPKTETENV